MACWRRSTKKARLAAARLLQHLQAGLEHLRFCAVTWRDGHSKLSTLSLYRQNRVRGEIRASKAF
jgi:hypothetical protein